MKRANHLMSRIADPDNLRLAFWKAQRGKHGKREVEHFRKNLDARLLLLRRQIQTARIDVGHYHYFTIYDPKERVICAASFPERVLHHALMNVCHEVFENFQIWDSYATRLGKGTYAALYRAYAFQKRYRWFLKLDVRKYFDSIDHVVLQKLLQRRFKERRLLSVFEQIISSYETAPGKGVPIGNLTSQYFANYYLAYADRLVKEQLKVRAYVRYMDDMVLWGDDKALLKEAGRALQQFLRDVLQVELKVWCLNKSIHGLNFVGYRLFPDDIKLNNRSKRRFIQKMKTYWQKAESGVWTQKEYQNHILPVLAFAEHASTRALRKKVIENIG